MKLLLDTHVLLWAIDRPQELSATARAALIDKSNRLIASVASSWEILLKLQAGTLHLDFESLESHWIRLGVTRFLPVELSHVRTIAALPPQHKDPFDRILIAQAIAEGLTIVSKDAEFRRYPVPVLW